MKKVIVLGASGHGKVISEIITSAGDEFVGFLDDDCTLSNTLGAIDDYSKFEDVEFVIGIGNSAIREKISLLPLKWYTAIHPSAIVSTSSSIGQGTVIMANAVVNAGAVIGSHCIVNTAAVVEHDNVVEDYAHISVGVKLGGTVHIGKNTWVGIGAVVSNNLNVCSNCLIGAGSVVVEDILIPGTYYGVPAKKHERGINL